MKYRSVFSNTSADMTLITLKINDNKKWLFVVIYKRIPLYLLFIFFCQHRSPLSWRMQVVSCFVEIHSFEFPFLCPFLLFKSNSYISFMVFIVSSSFPCINRNPVLHRFYDFCIGGLEEQRNARPRAAYLSNTNRLDSSKSHWNCIMHSSLVKYLPSE